MIVDRNELIKLMDVLENRKWTDDDTEDMLMEYRYNVSEAKTVYLVSIFFFSTQYSPIKLYNYY